MSDIKLALEKIKVLLNYFYEFNLYYFFLIINFSWLIFINRLKIKINLSKLEYYRHNYKKKNYKKNLIL